MAGSSGYTVESRPWASWQNNPEIMLSRFLRGIRRSSHILYLRPVANLAENGGTGVWQTIRPAPCFELESSTGRWPWGWVLLDSTLIRCTHDFTARLYFDTGDGFQEREYLSVATSRKGTIHEVVFFPHGLRGIRWVPMMGTGTIEQTGFRVTEIAMIERNYRMLRRIVPTHWKHQPEKLEMLGLGWRSALLDMHGAYSSSSKLRALAPAPDYAAWLEQMDRAHRRDRVAMMRHLERLPRKPGFVVLVQSSKAGDSRLARTLDSLDSQLYRNFQAHVLVSGAEQESLGKVKQDSFVICIKAGDVLAEHALYWMACAVNERPDAGLIYADEDRLDAAGARTAPHFKPDWSPQLLRSTNYIGRAMAVRGDVLASAGGVHEGDFIDNHAMLLRFTESLSAWSIVHIPAILFHCSGAEAAADVEAVRRQLITQGASWVSEFRSGCYRVHYPLPQRLPKVSILVPTRDAPSLIRQCIDSILQKSTYPDYEIVVVDNQSADAEALRYLSAIAHDSRVRVLPYDQPFNFSAMNNMAMQQAKGEVLCLLNNDTEVISPDWMEEMLGHLIQDKVGVVGAKLLYPDGRVQHGGDVVGVGGVANHLHAFLERDDPGYCNRAIVAQDLSAVTAACMMTWRKLYLDMGGLDEQNLPVAFNDVDYCLRVREAGYRVVWTPHAELFHHESVSRGKDDTPEKKARAKKESTFMRKRWHRELQHDPFYNPNLSYQRADFSLSHAPLVRRPWHK